MSLAPVNPFRLPPGISLAGATTDAAIKQVWERDNAAYGDENIGMQALRSWFQGYPAGGLYAWQDGRIVAGIGLWPLIEQSYKALRDGSLNEDSIGPTHFPRIGPDSTCAYWNLSGVFVEPEWRRTTVLPALMCETFWLWAVSGACAAQCSILGLAISEGGTKILRTLGFCVSSGNHSLPRYELQMDINAGAGLLVSKIKEAYAHRLPAFTPNTNQ